MMENFWRNRQEAQRLEALEDNMRNAARRAKQDRLRAQAYELMAEARNLWAQASDFEALRYYLELSGGTWEQLARLDEAESLKRVEGWAVQSRARELEAEVEALEKEGK